ncbi:MAG TPA: AraC family transcriptional regulator [Alphaproteobacteria bacterium]|nr:AraC family transcriptional regulator [Alphaproteobacteria bacterium]
MVGRMDVIEQSEAVDAAQFGAGDRARFWRARRHDGLEGLTATFRRHRYAPHTHETYVVGVIVAGCEAYHLRGERHYARAGEVCFVNPGEVHDGEPAGSGYAYRMTYPSVALMRGIAAELYDRDVVAAPFFPRAVVRDPAAFQAFVAAHGRIEQGADPLAADEALVRAYALMIARHAEGAWRPADAQSAGRAVQRVRDYLEAHFAEEVDLATLAAVAGLTRHHLIRLFKRETGLTPHAYLTDCRVRAARRQLASGVAPAEVAADCGFFDQSHLTRAFKSRMGVGPGAFRAA